MIVLDPIIIDTQDLSQKFGISGTEIQDVLDNIAKGLAARYAQQLEVEASNALNSTRSRYLRSIKVVDSGKLEATVLLDYSKDPLIKMIEEGASPFDIKLGMLNSSKVKMTKDGRRYLTVPFRWSTPGAVGESDVFTGQMPVDVYNVVRLREVFKKVQGGGLRSDSLKISDLPSQYQVTQTRQTIKDDIGNILFKAYEHKNALYEGIAKYQDTTTGQNTYHSFRRVSESGVSKDGKALGSDPNSWIHPGIEKFALMQKALNNFNIENEVGTLLDNEFARIIGG